MSHINVADKKDARIFLRLIQAQSPFKNVPVCWIPSKRGPKFHVSGAPGGTISVRLNYSGMSVTELHDVVETCLKAANEIYRDITLASAIASEGTGEHVGVEYVPNVSDWVRDVTHVLDELDKTGRASLCLSADQRYDSGVSRA